MLSLQSTTAQKAVHADMCVNHSFDEVFRSHASFGPYLHPNILF